MKKLCLLLSILMLSTFTAVCGNQITDLQESNDSDASVTDETTAPKKELPKIDFGGKIFVVLTTDLTNDYRSLEFSAEEINGTPVNDAVFERNSMIERDYGITFDIRQISDIPLEIRKAVQAGENGPDLALVQLYDTGPLFLDGMLCDLNSFEYIDFDSGSWDKKAAEQMSVGGTLLTALGDMNINDKDMTWCLFFNKNIAKDYDLPDLYSLVREKKWTFDKFSELCHNVTYDLNGDGKYDDNDLWGHVTVFARSAAAYTYSMGGYLTVKNEKTGYPELNLGSERIYDAYEKVRSLFFDSGECHDVETMPYDGFPHQWRKTEQMFGSEQILFCGEAMQNTERFRNYETDFGILPLPSWSENSYGNNMVWRQAFSTVIPATAGFNEEQRERAGLILEAIQEYSTELVKPAYYEKSLKGKFSRDNESYGMIDIIFDNRYYDICSYYGWGGITEALMKAGHSNDENLKSKLDSMKPAAESELMDMIEKSKEKIQ